MAFVKNPVPGVLAANIFEDVAANATGQDNLLGGTGTLYMARIDNSANSAETVYLKMYDIANPTIGTSRPIVILPCPASSTRQYNWPDGVVFTSYVSYAVVKTAGLQGSTSDNPSGVVKVYLATS